ncbi:L,D-transpeptidase [Candidatus Margulisiibacteriota bacterium]
MFKTKNVLISILIGLLAAGIIFSAIYIISFSVTNYFENRFYKIKTAKLIQKEAELKNKNTELRTSLDEQYAQFLHIYKEYLNYYEKTKDVRALHDMMQNKINILSELKNKVDTTDLYIVVSTEENKLWLKRGDKILKSYRVATGFKRLISDKYSKIKKYTSITPKTVMTVRKIVKKPVWIKPDWYYKEKNLPIPPIGSPKRRDRKALGPYAIYLQERYIIHGTYEKNDLGRNVSHGCIRMISKDLKIVFNNVKIGTEVYIY